MSANAPNHGQQTPLSAELARLWALGPVLKLKSNLLKAARDFFHDRNYLEAETPVLLATPALELHIDAIRAGNKFLRTSPELHMKRLLCAGYERIFQVGPCFRAGERGKLHNPEFTMLEWYRSKADYMDILAETKVFLRHCAQACLDRTWLEKDGLKIEIGDEWKVFSVSDLFEKHAGWNPALNYDESRFESDLIEIIEPRLPKDRPVVLMDYPAGAAALARLKKSDPRLSERWELYLGGIEIANAFSELTDPSEQRQRFEMCARERTARGAEVYELDQPFLAALETGMPESAGIALGIDRLAMLLAGVESIDHVLPFR